MTKTVTPQKNAELFSSSSEFIYLEKIIGSGLESEVAKLQEICGCRVTSSSHIKTRPGIIKQLTLLPQL
jgi:hypothetical protein